MLNRRLRGICQDRERRWGAALAVVRLGILASIWRVSCRGAAVVIFAGENDRMLFAIPRVIALTHHELQFRPSRHLASDSFSKFRLFGGPQNCKGMLKSQRIQGRPGDVGFGQSRPHHEVSRVVWMNPHSGTRVGKCLPWTHVWEGKRC